MIPQVEETKERLQRLIGRVSQADGAFEFLFCLARHWEQKGPDYLSFVHNVLRGHDALMETLKAINTERDLNALLEIILDKAIELTQAERGYLQVRDVEIARNFNREDIEGDYKISRSVAQKVRSTGELLLTDNAQFDPDLAHQRSIQEHRLVSILCVPVVFKQEILGVIYVDNRLVISNFKEHHKSLLSAFADQAAIAIENAKRDQELLEKSRELKLVNADLSQTVEKQSEKLVLAERKFKQFQRHYHYHNIHARSPKMLEMFRTLEKIKDYDLPVLIQGESGTGKELVAQAVHFSGARKEMPFVSENCAAIAESLFESELFGYEKGAFSGANQMHKGLFEQAEGGTLFLDEIGELSLEMQKKLLRTLAEKNVRRVGGRSPIPVDVRIITATNRNLREMVKSATFREDLYYRLNGVDILLPPLRERREDIPLLIERFLQEASEWTHSPPKKMERSVLSSLIGYDWPGNVRQLRNEIFRLSALSNEAITPRHLSPEISPCNDSPNPSDPINHLPQLLKEVEKREILKALEYCNQNKMRASRLLGISRFTLQRKLEKLGMK